MKRDPLLLGQNLISKNDFPASGEEWQSRKARKDAGGPSRSPAIRGTNHLQWAHPQPAWTAQGAKGTVQAGPCSPWQSRRQALKQQGSTFGGDGIPSLERAPHFRQLLAL